MGIDYNKVIWEGWTVQQFIDDLAPLVKMIMNGQSWQQPFQTKKELAKWCKENQSYYKKEIPEVVQHFCNQYEIK